MLRRCVLSMPWLCGLVAGASVPAVAAENAAIPKVSAFAPADDLIAQVDFFLRRMDEALAKPGDYDAASQNRAWKDGHTLSALLLMLAVHDQKHALSAAAPTMVESAQRMANAGENYEAAKQAFDALESARAGKTPAGEAAKWTKVASLAALMKQVPLVHAPLKRNVEPRRLKSRAADSAGQAATLAAIAQAAELDTEHATNPAEIEAWRQCCVEMRDASGAVNSAVRAGDAERVKAAMAQLEHSCETCHTKFRRP